MENVIQFKRFNKGAVRYCTLRLVRMAKDLDDPFKYSLDGSEYQYQLAYTNMGGETGLSGWFKRAINRLEERVLSDAETAKLIWRSDVAEIVGNRKLCLFRTKRPSYAVTIRDRSYEYGIGSVWDDGTIISDSEFVNIAQRCNTQPVEFIILE